MRRHAVNHRRPKLSLLLSLRQLLIRYFVHACSRQATQTRHDCSKLVNFTKLMSLEHICQDLHPHKWPTTDTDACTGWNATEPGL